MRIGLPAASIGAFTLASSFWLITIQLVSPGPANTFTIIDMTLAQVARADNKEMGTPLPAGAATMTGLAGQMEDDPSLSLANHGN